jgi:hypothetical protein
MANENLLSMLEQSLRQARLARARVAGRLAELEAETSTLRAELAEIESLATQSEAAIHRFLSVLSRGEPGNRSIPSDEELEIAMRQDSFTEGYEQRRHLPRLRSKVVVSSDRFVDRTIPQATTMLLRESGTALHVNEIYQLLLEGGFNFTGNNPTISIAVSLNRNGRFRKVAPGTFDLVIREATVAL